MLMCLWKNVLREEILNTPQPYPIFLRIPYVCMYVGLFYIPKAVHISCIQLDEFGNKCTVLKPPQSLAPGSLEGATHLYSSF